MYAILHNPDLVKGKKVILERERKVYLQITVSDLELNEK